MSKKLKLSDDDAVLLWAIVDDMLYDDYDRLITRGVLTKEGKRKLSRKHYSEVEEEALVDIKRLERIRDDLHKMLPKDDSNG